eukprot:scaffold243_cov140-Skeletonema_menzelii.AAC.7
MSVVDAMFCFACRARHIAEGQAAKQTELKLAKQEARAKVKVEVILKVSERRDVHMYYMWF